jgi:hypothetical protein
VSDFFRPTLSEFLKQAISKKRDLEQKEAIIKESHDKLMNSIKENYASFARQMIPYFEEILKLLNKEYIFIRIDDASYQYRIKYSNNRLKVELDLGTSQLFSIDISKDEEWAHNSFTNPDIDGHLKNFNLNITNPVFKSNITKKLLEEIV